MKPKQYNTTLIANDVVELLKDSDFVPTFQDNEPKVTIKRFTDYLCGYLELHSKDCDNFKRRARKK